MDGRITTKQAAEQLGVSVVRVGQLIHAGRLTAEKFGGRWAVSQASVDAQRGTVSGDGVSRPMSAKSLWALAAMLDGRRTTETASARYKIVRRARSVQTIDQVRRWGEDRYLNTLVRSVAEDEVITLLSDHRVSRTGASAVERLDAWDEVEFVVSADEADAVAADHELEEYFSGDIKATVHVTDTEAVGHRLIVALDLADSTDARTRDIGRDQLTELLDEMRTL